MSGLNERINSRNQLPQAHSSTMRTIPAKRKAVENSSPPSTSSSNVAPRLSTPHVDLRLLSGARHRRGETRAAARNAFTHQNQPRRSSGRYVCDVGAQYILGLPSLASHDQKLGMKRSVMPLMLNCFTKPLPPLRNGRPPTLRISLLVLRLVPVLTTISNPIPLLLLFIPPQHHFCRLQSMI